MKKYFLALVALVSILPAAAYAADMIIPAKTVGLTKTLEGDCWTLDIKSWRGNRLAVLDHMRYRDGCTYKTPYDEKRVVFEVVKEIPDMAKNWGLSGEVVPESNFATIRYRHYDAPKLARGAQCVAFWGMPSSGGEQLVRGIYCRVGALFDKEVREVLKSITID